MLDNTDKKRTESKTEEIQKNCDHDYSDYGVCLKCGYYNPDYDDLLYGMGVGIDTQDKSKSSEHDTHTTASCAAPSSNSKEEVNPATCEHEWEYKGFTGQNVPNMSGDIVAEVQFTCRKCGLTCYDACDGPTCNDPDIDWQQ